MSGDWTIGPCEQHDAHALAAALEISDVTASVLVRLRGASAGLAGRGLGLGLTGRRGDPAGGEVAEARARGLDVVVTDHHRPGPALPACPVVATLVGDYPFDGLCGTGVVLKLAQ